MDNLREILTPRQQITNLNYPDLTGRQKRAIQETVQGSTITPYLQDEDRARIMQSLMKQNPEIYKAIVEQKLIENTPWLDMQRDPTIENLLRYLSEPKAQFAMGGLAQFSRR